MRTRKTFPSGDANRAAIVEYLLYHPGGVMLKEITRATGLKRSTAHQHIERLRARGVVAPKQPRTGSIRLERAS